MKKVSLKDIAEMTGVSTSTVSFILNGKASEMRISEALKKKVLATANRLGYQPNQIAVSLRTGQTKILGLLVEDISNNFFAMLAKTIEDEAEKFGYRVVYCSTENDNKKGQALLRMLAQRQVDGFLITPTLGMEPDIKKLQSQHKPVVLMDRYFPEVDVPHVLVNNYGGVTAAMQHLIQQGYQRIGFITVDLALNQMQEREDAYADAINKTPNPKSKSKKNILSIDPNASREEKKKLITRFLRNNKPDAVFFATNYLGILGLECLREQRIRIPEELAVVCFDDHDIFRLYIPDISVVQQPVEEMGRKAVHLLMDQLGKNRTVATNNQLRLDAVFVPRESTQKN
jgi:LacI family transcriptional regulator